MQLSRFTLMCLFLYPLYMYSAQHNYTTHRPTTLAPTSDPIELVRSDKYSNLLACILKNVPQTPLSAGESPLEQHSSHSYTHTTATGFYVEYKSIANNGRTLLR